MVRIRRVAAIAILCVMAGAYGTVTPAHADTTTTTEALSGWAVGEGLDLSVLATSLTLGHADSAVKATLATGTKPVLTAAAKGAGQLLSASEVVTSAPTTAGGLLDAKDKACLASLPVAGLVNVELACGRSSSSVVGGLPIASATGNVLDLRVPSEGILGQLLGSVGGTIEGLLDTLLGGGISANNANATSDLLAQNPAGGVLSLGQVTQALPILNDLLGQAKNSAASVVPDPLVVTLGESSSSVVTSVNKITSTASGRGATVTVLPLPLFPKGLVQVIVGDANTSAVYDRAGGTATASFDPALLRLSVLGIDVPVVPNIDLTILAGTPLESTIKLGAGSVLNDGNSKAGAVADGVSLHLLKGLGEKTPGARNGGIKLSLAHAESSVGGKLVSTVVPEQVLGKVIEQPRQLPRTGGPGPLFPAIGVSVLALAFIGRRAVLRTR